MKDHEHTAPAFVLRFSRLFGVGPALSFPCDGTGRHATLAEVLEAADRACYAAKHAGRNTVRTVAPGAVLARKCVTTRGLRAAPLNEHA